MYFVQTGNGKPIVFLHGWGANGGMFLPIARLLDASCYLVDFRGFGNSDMPPENGWTVEDYAEDLFAFLQQNNLHSVTLVGHSFGCRVAIALAALHPQCVTGLVLVAPAGLRRFSLKRQLKVARYKLSKLFGKADLRNASDDYLNCDVALRNTFVKVVNHDVTLYAKRVACPVLIVNGRQDTATPLWHARKLRRLLKGSSLVEIDGDHFAFFRSPKAFAATVENFVE